MILGRGSLATDRYFAAAGPPPRDTKPPAGQFLRHASSPPASILARLPLSYAMLRRRFQTPEAGLRFFNKARLSDFHCRRHAD